MSLNDWLTIVAIILGPILAIQIQKFIEGRKQVRDRKMQVLTTLITTKATPLSPLHVEALNIIGVTFHKDKKIIEAWRLLLATFANYPKVNDPDYQTKLLTAGDNSNKLLVDLIYEMASSLGYDFDKTYLTYGAYLPQGHAWDESEQRFIRQSLVDLFLGKKSLPIHIVNEQNPQTNMIEQDLAEK